MKPPMTVTIDKTLIDSRYLGRTFSAALDKLQSETAGRLVILQESAASYKKSTLFAEFQAKAPKNPQYWTEEKLSDWLLNGMPSEMFDDWYTYRLLQRLLKDLELLIEMAAHPLVNQI